MWCRTRKRSLSTIHFYIILKLKNRLHICFDVWVPYIFTSFSNDNVAGELDAQFEYHTFLHHSQTSVAGFVFKIQFEYHTFLHHSQTGNTLAPLLFSLSTIHFYIILKHDGYMSGDGRVWVPYIFTSFSNLIDDDLRAIEFEYHTFLHHSQTVFSVQMYCSLFEYHTFLHHSQTSNSKMKCHHSHKIQVLKLLGCYISHPSLSIIYLVTPSMQSLAQVSINKSWISWYVASFINSSICWFDK